MQFAVSDIVWLKFQDDPVEGTLETKHPYAERSEQDKEGRTR